MSYIVLPLLIVYVFTLILLYNYWSLISHLIGFLPVDGFPSNWSLCHFT